MVGVVLAAGNGVRLRESAGKEVCKALEKVCGLYLIEFALNNLIELNIDKVFIVVGKQGDLIKHAIGEKYKSLNITYVSQLHQKGLINAFAQALPFIKDDGAVLQLADEIFVDLKSDEIKRFIYDMSCDFYCGITYESDPEKIKANFSVETDDAFLMKKCTEKPKEVINNIKGTGFCVFNSETLQILEDIYSETDNSPKDLCDFINYLLDNSKKGTTFCVAEREFNINTLSDLKEAEYFLSVKSGDV